MRLETGETFAVATLVCANRDCPCRRMVLQVSRVRPGSHGSNAGSVDRAPPLELSFDTENGTIEVAQKGGSDLPSGATAAIIERLRQPDMRRVMAERWTRSRSQHLPGVRPPRWKGGDLAAYMEVFPAGWDLVVPYKDALFLAVDQYCLNPGCGCATVAVQFVRMGDGADAGTATTSIPSKRDAHVSDDAEVRALWRALFDHAPPETFRRRFREMRGFARSLVPKIAPLRRPGTPRSSLPGPIPASERVYRLRVHIQRTEPPVWRRVELLGALPLSEMARAISKAFGWSNRSEYTVKSLAGPGGNIAYRETIGLPLDLQTTLDAAAVLPGARLRVEEPVDNAWELEIVVEAIDAARPGVAYPRVIDGESPAPPASRGADEHHDRVHAFYTAIDPKHDDAVRALGEAFDPELLPDDHGVPRPTESTDVPAEADDIPALLALAGPLLMRRTRDGVLALGDAAPPALLAIVTAAVELEPTWPLVHAVDLLGTLAHAPAVEPILRVMEQFPSDSPLQLKVQTALEDIGSPALEGILAAHARMTDPNHRLLLRGALASLDVRDPRIFVLLLGALRAGEHMAVADLVSYDDERAIPALDQALKKELAVRGRDLEDQLDIVCGIAMAIENLGGKLDPRDDAAVDKLVARSELGTPPVVVPTRTTGESVPLRPVATSSEKPGRNDPCWCGNGKKYKKCHLLEDEKNRTN